MSYQATKYTSLESFFSKADLSRTAFTYFIDQKLHQATLGEFYKGATAYKEAFLKNPSHTWAFILPHTYDTLMQIIGAMLAKKRVALIPSSVPSKLILMMLQSIKAEDIRLDPEEFEPEEIASFQQVLSPTNVEASPAKEAELLFFTSGTTGVSKAVLLSFSSFLSSAYNGQSRLATTPKDTVISFLPFEHVFGFVCSFLWPLLYGSTTAISRGLGYLEEDLKIMQPTIIPLVPSIARFMLLKNIVNPEATTLLVGSGPIEENDLKAYASKGLKVAFGYGLTETASGVAISVDSKTPFWMSPCPEDSFKLEDNGALAIKSSCLMKGYFLNGSIIPPILDKEGYFLTNDLADIDQDGRIRIIGRVDDILVLDNGTKINAQKEEKSLSQKLGALDFSLGVVEGKLVLYFYPKNPEDKALVSQEINAYNLKAPLEGRINGLVELPSPLPRTLTGKVRRFLLKATDSKK